MNRITTKVKGPNGRVAANIPGHLAADDAVTLAKQETQAAINELQEMLDNPGDWTVTIVGTSTSDEVRPAPGGGVIFPPDDRIPAELADVEDDAV